jgi:hypothetical protein
VNLPNPKKEEFPPTLSPLEIKELNLNIFSCVYTTPTPGARKEYARNRKEKEKRSGTSL